MNDKFERAVRQALEKAHYNGMTELVYCSYGCLATNERKIYVSGNATATAIARATAK